MPTLLLKIYRATVCLLADQDAQNLVEYCLIVSCLAFASVAGMHSLASGVSVAFNNVSSDLASAI
ncbi:MAG: Flp family type IVb pilin [Terracidiphilus sp.]